MRKLLIAASGLGGLWALNRLSATRDSTKWEISFLSTGFSQRGLEDDGITLLPGVLSQHEISLVKGLPCYVESDRYLDHSSRGELDLTLDRQTIARMRSENVEGVPGRYHRVKFDRESLDVLDAFEGNWKDRVEDYLGPDAIIRRSQLQLLFSEPKSKDQFFHQDNARKGITIIIPLSDVHLDMGPTHLLPGSHNLTQPHDGARTSWSQTLTSLSSVVTRLWAREPLRAAIPAGTALFYDGRVLHRGLGNLSEKPRPVLVFRYDLVQYPPPQAGVIHTTLVRGLGYVLNALVQVKQII
ncbi:hypothetical protein AAMO2058_000573800 [Amorphochlora amoebiformis]|mmetsp:Transcript_19375/g.30778  ORF Transcript_19375/g.30778 Transcript_19375/m.30778 type:complete len:298 (-) Transcript_19375:113-1006(-)